MSEFESILLLALVIFVLIAVIFVMAVVIRLFTCGDIISTNALRNTFKDSNDDDES